jgi:hypothetical protein
LALYLIIVLDPSREVMAKLACTHDGKAFQPFSSCQLKECRRLARRPGVATPLGRVYLSFSVLLAAVSSDSFESRGGSGHDSTAYCPSELISSRLVRLVWSNSRCSSAMCPVDMRACVMLFQTEKRFLRSRFSAVPRGASEPSSCILGGC